MKVIAAKGLREDDSRGSDVGKAAVRDDEDGRAMEVLLLLRSIVIMRLSLG